MTTQFVSFVSQQNGQCENVEVRKIASIKSEGPGPTDKFSPAGVALMAPIAAPFLAAHEVKHRFDKQAALDGHWQSSAAPGGAVTWLDIASGTIRKTFVIRKQGTYRVDGDNLAISYLPDQSKEEVIPIRFACDTLVTGSGQTFHAMLNSGPVGEPIAGIWTLKYDRDHTWEFRRDGTFRMSEMKTAGYPASLRLTNGQAAVTWKGPNQTAEEWIVRKQGDQLLIVQGGISTTYTKRPNP